MAAAELLTTKYPTLDLKEIRERLLTQYVPRLGERMGAVYRDVTYFCLSIDPKANSTPSDGASREEGIRPDGELLAPFVEYVIEPLEKLARMVI